MEHRVLNVHPIVSKKTCAVKLAKLPPQILSFFIIDHNLNRLEKWDMKGIWKTESQQIVHSYKIQKGLYILEIL